MIAGAARALCLALLVIGGLGRPGSVRAAEPGRAALVVGEASYAAPGWALEGPREDAALVAEALGKAGFDVELALDADAAALAAAVARLGERAAAAGPDGVGFFYFAGHALRAGDALRLLAVDASVAAGPDAAGAPDAAPVQPDSVDAASGGAQAAAPADLRLDAVLAALAPLPPGRAFVAVDACRDTPLAAHDPATRACAPLPAAAPAGPLIAFAAGPGQLVALDAGGAFAGALAAALSVRALPAGKAFAQAAARVRAATAGRQTPWIAPGAPGAPYYFAGPPSPDDFDARTAESLRWDFARRRGDASAYRGYLAAHPDGRFVGPALERIEALDAAALARAWGAAADAPAADDQAADSAAGAAAGPDLSAYRAPDPEDVLLLETTKGGIAIEMAPELAPKPAAQIRELAREGAFDGAPFDRVVDGFRAESSVAVRAAGKAVAGLPRDLLAPAEVAPAPMEVADKDRNRIGVYAREDVAFGLHRSVPMAERAPRKDDRPGTGPAAWATHCPGVASLTRGQDGERTLFIMRGESPGLDGEAEPWGAVIDGLDAVYDLEVGDALTPGFEPDRILSARVLSDVSDAPKVLVLDETGPGLEALLAALRDRLGRPPRVCEVRPPLAAPVFPAAAAAAGAASVK